MRHAFFLSGVTLAIAATPVVIAAQQNPSTTTNTAPGNPNPDLTRSEVANFDGFLDAHPTIDRQLDTNPALINDQGYLKANPDLQTYLTEHPQVRQEISETPNYFMQREGRLEARENAGANRPPENNRNLQQPGTGNNAGGTPNPDLTRSEVANFDGFLDSHPTIDRQLDANPSLINDQNYLKANPDLQTYLSEHPQVRQEVSETPNYFMQRENRLEARENDQPNNAARTNGAPPQNQANTGSTDVDRQRQQDRLDQYLSDHKNVDHDLRNKPSLANDDGYLRKHRDLDEFLKANPDVRVLIVSNPHYFEDRDRDREQFAMNANVNARAGVNATASGNMRKEDADRMDDFLDKHQGIAKDFHNNPSLCDDDKYISRHKDLREFYDRNPDMRHELAQNRNYFDERNQRMEQRMANPSAKKPVGPTTSPSANQPPTQTKSPVDQRQDMTPNTLH